MRYVHIAALTLVSMLSIHSVFADDVMMSNSKSCDTVATACMNAGFSRDASSGKKFWFDCMKPLVLGKTVEGVTIDPAVVKTCRSDKIKALKKELHEFRNAS